MLLKEGEDLFRQVQLLLCLTKTYIRVAWHDSLPCLQAEHMLRQGRLQDANQLMAVRTSALPF